MEYYSAIKNQTMRFAATWIDLEMIILSEVCQRQQDKYYIISLLHGIYNMAQMNLFMKQTQFVFPKSSHNLQWCHRWVSYWFGMMREKAYHQLILKANISRWRQWTWDSFLSGVSMRGGGTSGFLTKQKDLKLPKGRREGMEWEVGINRCKLIHTTDKQRGLTV